MYFRAKSERNEFREREEKSEEKREINFGVFRPKNETKAPKAARAVAPPTCAVALDCTCCLLQLVPGLLHPSAARAAPNPDLVGASYAM